MPDPRITSRSLNDQLMADAIDLAKAGRAGVDWLDERMTALELRVAALESRAQSSAAPGAAEVRSPHGWRIKAPAWAAIILAVSAIAVMALYRFG